MGADQALQLGPHPLGLGRIAGRVQGLQVFAADPRAEAVPERFFQRRHCQVTAVGGGVDRIAR